MEQEEQSLVGLFNDIESLFKHTADMCAKHLIDGCKIREFMFCQRSILFLRLFFRHHKAALVSANGIGSHCYCI